VANFWTLELDAAVRHEIASQSSRVVQHAGIEYTLSRSGRAAIFFRDPDENCLEAVEIAEWRM
jgi:hypothetical protein